MDKEDVGAIMLIIVCATLVIMCGLVSWAWVATH